MATARITVQNVVQPGKTYQVDAAKYAEMRARVLEALPDQPPGMKVADLIDAVRPRLDPALFPGGKTAGWWVKCVQLDLEAKGVIARTAGPVRLWRVQP